MRKKSFTHEVKQECINLVLQHKYPVTQVAETMNIDLSTFQPFSACVTDAASFPFSFRIMVSRDFLSTRVAI